MQSWDMDKVFELFTSSFRRIPRSKPSIYGIMAHCLEEKWIIVSSETYLPSPEPHPGEFLWEIYQNAFIGKGGQHHGELKWSAWNWLNNQGERYPQFEYPVFYGRADVVAQSKQYVIECGDTAPEKVFLTLGSGLWKAFILFPFIKPKESPQIYKFQQTLEGKSYIEAIYKDWRKSRIPPAQIFFDLLIE